MISKPSLSRTVDQSMIDAAAANGMPVKKSLQVVARASVVAPDGKALYWYTLSDGSEVIENEKGQAVEWPE